MFLDVLLVYLFEFQFYLNWGYPRGDRSGTCRPGQETPKRNDSTELCDSFSLDLLRFELLCWQAIMYLSHLCVKPPHNSWRPNMITVCRWWKRLWILEPVDAGWKWGAELWIRDKTSRFSNNLGPDSSADESSCISVFNLTIPQFLLLNNTLTWLIWFESFLFGLRSNISTV